MSRKNQINTFDIAMKKRLNKFIAIAHHAMQLEQWLGKVVGYNSDWPVHLRVDNDDDANKLRDLLQAVAEAGTSVKADGECMRQLMRWQAETFGNPYDANGELRPGCNCE